jgi:hypothetical protein
MVDSASIHRIVIRHLKDLFVKHKKRGHKGIRTAGLHQALLPWTVVSAVLIEDTLHNSKDTNDGIYLLSIGTGTFCVSGPDLLCEPSRIDDMVHDGHAEIMARRGLMAMLWNEIQLCEKDPGHSSTLLERNRLSSPKYVISDRWRWVFYISQAPCGDASIPLSTESISHSHSQDVLLGHSDFTRVGIVRRKPARRDAPSTLSMSCSDKLALWAAIGIQGAFLSKWVSPIIIDDYVVGPYRYSPTTLQRAISRTTIRPLQLYPIDPLTIKGCEYDLFGDFFDPTCFTGKPSPISTCSWRPFPIFDSPINIISFNTNYIAKGWKQGGKTPSSIAPSQLFPLNLQEKCSAVEYQEMKAYILKILHGWQVTRAEISRLRSGLIGDLTLGK